MADIWYDVDTALSEVPVNILPLLDATDFKTIEDAVAYNAAGLALHWHFCTTAGAYTVTAVTPTTGGNYDWTDQGTAGIYTIEIPASGGASINNDTEGFGWFTGVATGVLPWRGPVCGFRAAALNNSMIDGTTIDVNVTAMAPNVVTASAVADGAVDLATFAADAKALFGVVAFGTMQAGSTSTTAVLAASTSFADDLINYITLVIYEGTGAGQARALSDWVSATDTGTVSPAWTTTPDNTSKYVAIATPPTQTEVLNQIADAVWDEATSGHTTAGSTGKALSDVLVDTSEIGAAGAGLTNINLPDQTMNITGNITGNLSGSVGSVTGAVGSVTGAVGSVTGNVGGNVTGSVGSLAAQAKTDVNAEVVDALATDTYAEPGQGAPAATTSLAAKINYLYKNWRNRKTQTATTWSLYADDATTVDQKSTVADDATTASRTEIASGP